MDTKLKNLRIRQLDKALRATRSAAPRTPPADGWVRAIREALGMTTTHLARRLGTSRQAISELERREVRGTVTLDALRRAADALECDLVYALVPRTDLRAMREHQAKRHAERELGRVAHSMRLEAQYVAPAEHRQQVAERADELLRSWSRRVWDERE
jgi:predicted DNA-binding mobile mystery protein A